MKFREIEKSRFVLIFQTGDEIATTLKQFAAEHTLSGASFKAVGALSSVKLGWYNPDTKSYDTCVDLQEQVELLSFIGDVATYEHKPSIHAHVVVGLRDGTTRGGHLIEAVVHPTCELFLQESPAHLSKRVDPESQLPLIAL